MLGYILCFVLVLILLLVLKVRKNIKPNSIGFLHPYCNSGGGGERVLWTILQSLLESYPNSSFTIYTVEKVDGSSILRRTSERFQIELPERISFVYLSTEFAIRPFPFLTLFFQLIGSSFLMMEALWKHPCSYIVDTHGLPGSYPVSKLFGIPIMAYVHYPFISTDMISRVGESRPSYNNKQYISKSRSLGRLKQIYYYGLLKIYGWFGYLCSVVLCNSRWTDAHIRQIWKVRTSVVYPPCDTSTFVNLPLDRPQGFNVVSIGQFRPEKDHELQLLSFKEFIDRLEDLEKQPKLIIVGSCRDEDDERKVKSLQNLSKELGIEKFVDFKVNASYQSLIETLGQSHVGIHTMWNEHFGISVVEMMAAGLLVIAHNSGGPKEDIVNHRETGFLCRSPEEYAEALKECYSNHFDEIKEAARESSQKYSEQAFVDGFAREFSYKEVN